MEKDANYFAVGIFVSTSLLLLTGFLIWLMGMHSTQPYDSYTIYFTDPVSGLSDDAVVKYKGVEVGKIVTIGIAPGRSDLIKVDISVKEETPIRSGTTANIEIQGITGMSYIELATETGDKNPPPRIEGEKYPVLQGKGNQLNRFFDDLPKISKELLETMAGIKDLSHESVKTVQSFRALSDKIKENPSQILFPPSNKGVVIPK